MTDRGGRKHNPHSRMVHRRVVGLTGVISAFVTLGLGPLAGAPKARADGFDVVVDAVLNAVTGLLGDVGAGSAPVPELGGLGLGAAESTAGVGLGSLSEVGPVAAGLVDTWLHGLEQDWINSGVGQQVDTVLNSWFNLVDPTTGACGLICNGTDGVDGQGGGLIFGDPGSDTQSMSPNLLVDPNFQMADPSGSGYNGVTIPGWTESGTPTVIAYGTLRGYPSVFSSPFPKLPAFLGFPQHAPPGTPAGDDYFAGGGPVATSSISQTVDLSGAGGTPFTLSADLGGQGVDPSYASVQVSFLGSHGDVLGTDSLQPVTVWDRLGITGFEQREISGTVPVGTTSAQVTTIFTDQDPVLGNYNGAYAANESFTVGDPSLTPASLTPPGSDVGHLDHVFLIYLENQGDGAVLGNPNAPYINSLIKTEDFDSNYYSLGHPSNPNYLRIMGGSSFGIDYNVPTGTINAPTLMQEMDQAGISWASYAQGIAPGTVITPQDTATATPFGIFDYVYDNTSAYLQEHILPQADLSSALQNPSTFPDFAWVKPDGSGPSPSLSDELNPILESIGIHPSSELDTIIQFIGGDILNLPYNLKNEDYYLQQTISTIENSPTWTDPSEKDAIFITWDEDNNEASLGIGNEGNNVPMIVIPNQGAVTDGGMQAGPFTTDAYYNQYSLMATIEDALRAEPGTLAPLTANDKYATPMNAFWK
jgi:hypothetical protein